MHFEKNMKLLNLDNDNIIKYVENKPKFKNNRTSIERYDELCSKNEQEYKTIFLVNKNDNDEEEETNLNNVLLLNPQNDEAIYMLALLKIKQSDYDQAKELIENFTLVCKSSCSKKDEIQEKLKKITPENAKDYN